MIDKVIKGIVVHGNGNGKKILVPTANLAYKESIDIENAVYVSIVQLQNEKYIGVTSIGRRPTIDDEEKVTVETHILDFDRDIYGMELIIIIKEKLRDIQKFGSIADLKKQLESDIIEAKSRSKKYV